MKFNGQRYYRFNRFFLEMTGLWLYNNSKFTYIYRAFTIFVFVSCSITQLIKLQSIVHDLDRFLYCLTYTVPNFIYITNYLSFIVKTDRIKDIMDRVLHDWNTLEDERECEIIRYHVIIGMRYSIVFFAILILLLFSYILSLYLPSFLDFVHPLNESRSRKLPLLAEYCILDEQKYFYSILMHQSLSIALGLITVIVTSLLNLLYLQHACGLFEVIRYRLKHVFDDGMFSVNTNEKYAIIYARIVKIITIHRRTVEFLDYLMSTYEIPYFIMLVFGIIAMIINLFRLIEAVLAMNDFEELLGSGSISGGLYAFLFFVHYFGQKLTDRSILMFDKVYDISWYTAPVHIQKLFIFILQRTVKGYVLNIGGVIMVSLESFASMASMTLSYLTMLYSVR